MSLNTAASRMMFTTTGIACVTTSDRPAMTKKMDRMASSQSGARLPLTCTLRIRLTSGRLTSDTTKARIIYISTLRKYQHRAPAIARTPIRMIYPDSLSTLLCFSIG